MKDVYIQYPAYLAFEGVIVCFSALLLGVLPGRSRGHYWPPFNPQVDGDNRKSKSQKVDIGSPCLFYIFVDILADLWDLKYNEFTSTSFQVFGPEISTYFTDPYTFLHFEV